MSIELYYEELESLIETILNKKSNPQSIKEYGLNRFYLHLEKFSNLNTEKNVRYDFVETILKRVQEVEFELKSEHSNNHNEKILILEDLKEYLKKVFKDIKISSMKGIKPLSAREKVILIEYMGILKLLSNNDYNQKRVSKLLGLLFDRSADNIKHYLISINGKMGIEGAVKDKLSLNNLKVTLERLEEVKLLEKINDDLDKLDK